MEVSMRAGSRAQAGFTYVAALFAIAIFAVGLAAAGQTVSAAAQRDREAELIRDGVAVVRAIRSYYYASPGAARTLPKSWDDLLEDRRFASVRRHLRQIPLDPFSFKEEWGEVRDPDGSFIGIYSLSDKRPFRETSIAFDRQVVDPGGSYRGWKFQFAAEPEVR